MYEHRYKHGKQKQVMPLAAFQAAMLDAINHYECLEALAYVTLLWHTGVRKSEAYERPVSDVTVTEEFVIVDFHERKKGGEEVPPLKIPRGKYGVEEFLVPWIKERMAAKPPHRESWKRLFYQGDEYKTRLQKARSEGGKSYLLHVKRRIWRKERAIWLFPHIASTRAWTIVKRVLGENYYPHYLRLRKLTAVAQNPKTATIPHIKAVSGLKTISGIQAYMGISQKAQDEAMQGSE